MIRVRNKKIYKHGSLQLLTTEAVYIFSYIAALFATAANIPYEEAVDRLAEIVKHNGKVVFDKGDINEGDTF